MATGRLTRGLAYAWVVVLSAAVLGPALLPGFALSYDLVFTPRQDLLPASIGVGSGLPRAVPQDAIVSLLEVVVPGALLEKAFLLASLVLAGTGMLRLLRGTTAGVVAATVAIANPFVAQRLVIGHWGLLLAYALAPWALHVARRLRSEGDPWDGLRLVLLVAAGALTPSGSLLLSLLAVPPILLPGSAVHARERGLIAGATVATWLPWLLPALLHPAVTSVDPAGTAVFAWRPEAPGGALVSAVTGGGIWNAEVVLASRGSALTWVLATALLALGALGARRLWRHLGVGVGAWWIVIAVAGVAAAIASAALAGAWSSAIEAVPGGGLLRDAHKLLAPWVLLLAAAAGEGAGRLASLTRERAAHIAVGVSLVILPLACQPDILGGIGGRLSAVSYPADWAAVRETLERDERGGDVASFPWTSFRRFAWNADRTVLDPAPRWMPRTTVVADSLDVATPEGVVVIAGEDPRARAIAEGLAAGEYASRLLPGLGIGWALVAAGTPGPVPDLRGWELVVDGTDLDLYAAPVAPTETVPPPGLRLVAAVDLAVLAGLLAGVVALGFRRVRARGRSPLIP